ncbi:hypothetical protein CDAR_107761 [Caerostris darwini]|uniref:Uncharacterized protein n=1 Tax=Caerostris darwini TaxID=1538125 RepID=A0AAV4T405_9ARAC|nr:hypothetical protein CDAR_107761 [Caerostris darwini]
MYGTFPPIVLQVLSKKRIVCYIPILIVCSTYNSWKDSVNQVKLCLTLIPSVFSVIRICIVDIMPRVLLPETVTLKGRRGVGQLLQNAL